MTVFLIIVGLTGSLLAFHDDLDRWVCPSLYPPVQPNLRRLDMGELATRAQTLLPNALVTGIYTRDPERAEIRYKALPEADLAVKQNDSLLLDPYTGDELGRRKWGEISQGSINLMPFIYALHYRLALGSFGMWLLGIVAVIWTLDCFIGFYLTLPQRRTSSSATAATTRRTLWQRWSPAWRIKRAASPTRLNFDLHRAGGLWLWLVLLVFAWSSVYMNLWDTVYTWSTRAVMDYRPYWTELEKRPPGSSAPRMSWTAANERAQTLIAEQAKAHGFSVEQAVSLRYYVDTATYGYQVRSSRDIQDQRGHTRLFFDAATGEFKYLQLPSGQYNGNTVTSWLYALHMANVFGLPWRIFVSVLGLLVTALSITGVLIWVRKRKISRYQTN